MTWFVEVIRINKIIWTELTDDCQTNCSMWGGLLVWYWVVLRNWVTMKVYSRAALSQGWDNHIWVSGRGVAGKWYEHKRSETSAGGLGACRSNFCLSVCSEMLSGAFEKHFYDIARDLQVGCFTRWAPWRFISHLHS